MSSFKPQRRVIYGAMLKEKDAIAECMSRNVRTRSEVKSRDDEIALHEQRYAALVVKQQELHKRVTAFIAQCVING